ncbi:MAG: helix-turn-helix domain-containing protein [Anaerolineaceae bacterium]|nr:MAG: helix-turn-helix domain-containing protein [Anaerolineaceae bacterium]
MKDQPTLTLRTKMLGAMLREARLKANKSLKEVATLIGATSGAVSSYEHGRKGISLPELELFAYHLDIPLEHFTTGSTIHTIPKTEFDPTIMVSLRQRMVGALLRKHRKEAEMSIRALADAAGLPSKRLSAYERGERPIPLPELERLVTVLGQSLKDYIDREGPVGEWISNNQAFANLLQLPPELRDFLSTPENQSYLRAAKHISELSVEKLRALAEGLLDLTL